MRIAHTRFPDNDGGYSTSRHCFTFGWTAATWLAIGTAAVGATTAVVSADSARSTQNKATDQAKTASLANQQATDEANNRANAKAPDSAAAMAANVLAGKAGNSGTMLTGPTGVDPSQLTLGKNTLLGS